MRGVQSIHLISHHGAIGKKIKIQNIKTSHHTHHHKLHRLHITNNAQNVQNTHRNKAAQSKTPNAPLMPQLSVWVNNSSIMLLFCIELKKQPIMFLLL